MNEIHIAIVIVGEMLVFALIFAIWIFGLRPFVAKNGRARITAVGWTLSMWADWSTAYEIGKETGNKSWAARLFILAWIIWLLLWGSLFIIK